MNDEQQNTTKWAVAYDFAIEYVVGKGALLAKISAIIDLGSVDTIELWVVKQ